MHLIPDNPNTQDLHAAKAAVLSTETSQARAETVAIATTAISIGMLGFAMTMPDKAPAWAMWVGILLLAIASMVNGLAVIAHQISQIRFACIAGSIIAELRKAQPVKDQPAFASLKNNLAKQKRAVAVAFVAIIAMLPPSIMTLAAWQRWGWLAICLLIATSMIYLLNALSKQTEVLSKTIRVPVSKT